MNKLLLTTAMAAMFASAVFTAPAMATEDNFVPIVVAAHKKPVHIPTSPAKGKTKKVADNVPQGPLMVSNLDYVSCQREMKAPGEFNSLHAYTCAYIYMAETSLPLADADKLAQFVKDWNPAQWKDSDYLKMDGVSEQERVDRTFALIRRMRDGLGNPEPFDYVHEPKNFSEEQKAIVHPVFEGGIGAMLKQENGWEISKKISGLLPKDPPKNQAEADARAKIMDDNMVIDATHRLMVEGLMIGGPSQGVLKDNDVLAGVVDNGNLVSFDGMKMSDAIKLIKGTQGSTVTLRVLRTNSQGQEIALTFTLTRATFAQHAVVIHDGKDGIRHIVIENFSNDLLLTDVYNAVTDAKAKGMKGLILDVRNDPGGRLDYVKGILEMLVPRGEIMMTRQRDGGTTNVIQEELVMDGPAAISETQIAGAAPETKRFQIVKRVDFSDDYAQNAMHNPGYVEQHPLAAVLDGSMPIVVLANNRSYSAAEIFAGGLRETHNAVLIGEATAGKDDIMTGIPVPECIVSPDKKCAPGELDIISGLFYPGGVDTDRIGVIPDQLVTQADDFGQTDAQLDAARAEIEKRHAAIEAGNAAADKSRKFNSDRFAHEIQKRNENDAKPVVDQDPLLKE